MDLGVQGDKRTRLPAASREALNSLAAMHTLLSACENQFIALFGRVGKEDDYWKIKSRLETMPQRRIAWHVTKCTSHAGCGRFLRTCRLRA